jgi:hypothetical protein
MSASIALRHIRPSLLALTLLLVVQGAMAQVQVGVHTILPVREP